MQINALYYGDCLDWMRKWDDNSVDLIYLDPPFNSKANYNQLYHEDGGGDAQYRAFADMWFWDEAAADCLSLYENAMGRKAHDVIMGLSRILGPCGMLSYLTYMAERLEHCHRLLSDAGSLYLHCDPTASHYLKILLDGIWTTYGGGGFRNEIVWSYNRFSRRGDSFAAMHDIVLFYGKSKSGTFNKPKAPARDTTRYDKGWHVVTDRGETRLLVYDESKAAHKIIEAQNMGRTIKFTNARLPTLGTVWTDISILNPMSKERLGYQTQKPEALLERIIKASSNEEDIVLDPFCGCGTTAAVARKLNRQFIGIDISSFAIDLVRERKLKDKDIPVYGIPFDLRSAEKLSRDNPFNFESWAVTRLPGFAPNTKQVADGGVDGRATITHKPDDWESQLALAQVKGGNFSLSGLRDFIHVTNRDNAALGCYVTLKPVASASARREIATAGKVSIENTYFPRMQIWSMKDYFDERRPRLPIMNDPYTGKPIQQLELF